MPRSGILLLRRSRGLEEVLRFELWCSTIRSMSVFDIMMNGFMYKNKIQVDTEPQWAI